jgi:hypothetical protein
MRGANSENQTLNQLAKMSGGECGRVARKLQSPPSRHLMSGKSN